MLTQASADPWWEQLDGLKSAQDPQPARPAFALVTCIKLTVFSSISPYC